MANAFPSNWTSEHYHALQGRGQRLIKLAREQPGSWLSMGPPFETRVTYDPDRVWPPTGDHGCWLIKTKQHPGEQTWEFVRQDPDEAVESLVKGVTEAIWQGGYRGPAFGDFMGLLEIEIGRQHMPEA